MTPARRVLDWTWDEPNGWVNGDGDAALLTEIPLIEEIERLQADVGTLSQIASDALMLASYGSTSRLSAKRSDMVTNLVGEFLAWDKARTRREEATA